MSYHQLDLHLGCLTAFFTRFIFYISLCK